MAYIFGDSFDLYAAPADALNGYWDSGGVSFTLVAGRFAGSQAAQNLSTGAWLVKSSGQNDAIHHIVCAFQTTATITGTNLGLYFQLSDGATNQVCIVFRSDGAIVLTSATPAGTVLATYPSAFTAASVWNAYEFEVVIHPSAGSFAVRRNGNTSNDFSATALNTRPGTNSYANKLTVGCNVNVTNHLLDDLLWRSDTSAVPWVGDVRAFVRRPASDAAVQWSPSSAVVAVTPFAGSTASSISTTQAKYSPFTPTVSGQVGSVSVMLNVPNPGNMKCSIYSDSATHLPALVLGSATVVNNALAGSITFTFPSPVAVTAGTQYWVGWMGDTVVTNGWLGTSSVGTGQQLAGTTYAAFPVANPATSNASSNIFTVNVSPAGGNWNYVADTVQDAATSYVYSSTVGQSDLYGISAIGSTPASIVAVTTRAYLQKSDAGTRNVAVQLKSGGTTVQSASTALNTTWGHIYRMDTTDPATGSAWTAVGVNNTQIGVIVTA